MVHCRNAYEAKTFMEELVLGISLFWRELVQEDHTNPLHAFHCFSKEKDEVHHIYFPSNFKEPSQDLLDQY